MVIIFFTRNKNVHIFFVLDDSINVTTKQSEPSIYSITSTNNCPDIGNNDTAACSPINDIIMDAFNSNTTIML